MTKQDIDLRRVLKLYLGHRVRVTGFFDRFHTIYGSSRDRHVTLLQDAELLVDGGDREPLGHVWLQNTEALRQFDLNVGDRLTCNCKVGSYRKQIPDPSGAVKLLDDYNLSYPYEVEVTRFRSANGVPAEEPATSARHAEEPPPESALVAPPPAVEVVAPAPPPVPPPAPPEVVPEPVLTPPPQPAAPTVDFVKAIRLVRQLGERFGGLDKLVDLLPAAEEVAAQVGGTQALLDIARELGG